MLGLEEYAAGAGKTVIGELTGDITDRLVHCRYDVLCRARNGSLR